MSLMDLVVGQKMIVLAVGAALSPLLLALMLWLAMRLRQARAKHQAHQLFKQVQAEAALKEKAAAAAAQAAAAASEEPVTARPIPLQPVQPGPALVLQFPEEENTQSAEGTQEGQTETTEQTDPDAASAIQDLLTSVFGGDDLESPYEVLLRSLGEVKVNDLQALCDQIAGSLTGSQSVPQGKER